MQSDPEAALSAQQGSVADTQVLSPPAGESRRGGGDELPDSPRTAGRRRGKRIAAVGAIALVAVAVALAALLRPSDKPRADTGGGLPAGETTVIVQRRTLTEHAQVDGTLGYGGALELYDRLAGTFTWLPSVGSVIERGGTLFKVNQLPIVLMYGVVPAYRTLKEGVSDGQDVTQLNENLVALGYDPSGAITDYEQFSEATATAVRRWQQAEGLPQTGVVELGRVVFAPSARRVTAVKPTLGQDPLAGEGSEPAKGTEGAASKEKEPVKEERPAKEEEPAKAKEPAKGPGAGNSAKAGSPSKSEESPSKSEGSPSKGGTSEGEPSGGAGAGVPVLTTTSVRQLVQVDLEADKQQLARVGASVPITLPSGQTVHARIASVGSVATESGGGSGEGGGGKASIPVTLVLDHRVPRLDAAPVTVELIKERRRGVLSIPATALIATAGGGYAVEALEGQRRVEVPVTPGMFADGYVQIEGAGVHAGLTVTEPAE